VSAQFRAQLEVLLHTLQGTQPHYVMCYKPNTTGAPNALDRVLLLEQLRYSGALEVVRIRQKGYDTSLFWLWQILAYDCLCVYLSVLVLRTGMSRRVLPEDEAQCKQ
jgi:hypothetical protein